MVQKQGKVAVVGKFAGKMKGFRTRNKNKGCTEPHQSKLETPKYGNDLMLINFPFLERGKYGGVG